MVKCRKRKTARQLLLEKKKRKRQFIINVFGYSLLGILFVFILVVYFSYASFMNLQGIVVNGYHTPYIIRKVLINHLDNNSNILNPRNFYIINKNDIEKTIKDNINDVEDVKVEKLFKDRIIKISIKEKIPIFYVCDIEKECYFVDSYAIAYKKTKKQTKNLTFVLVDKDIKLLDKVFDKNIYDNLILIKNLLKEINFSIKEIKIKQRILAFAYVKSFDGAEFFIKFDLEQPIKQQIDNLKIALKKINKSDLDYIDLRFGNKIFYKMKKIKEQDDEEEQ